MEITPTKIKKWEIYFQGNELMAQFFFATKYTT